MALALQPTLGEIRTATLDRCGLATTGNIPRNIQGILDERIRSAQLQLYEEAPWLASYVKREIPLVTSTIQYDVPDDCDPGNIDFVCVRRLSDGKLYELEPGIRPTEPNLFVNSTANMPLRYHFIDQIMEIQPVPDVTRYDVLMLWYKQSPPKFIEDGERAVVDGEALKMLSEALVKDHFGGQDTTALYRALGRYIGRKRSRQSDGAGFQMGGHQSVLVKTQRRNRFVTSGYGGGDWQDWRPW